MARNTLRSDDEQGFLEAITDEWYDLEVNHGVLLNIRVARGTKRGQLHFLCSAISEADSDAGQVHATFVGEYPSHSANRLYAGLYRTLVRLGIELREYDRERERRRTANP